MDRWQDSKIEDLSISNKGDLPSSVPRFRRQVSQATNFCPQLFALVSPQRGELVLSGSSTTTSLFLLRRHGFELKAEPEHVVDDSKGS